MKIVIAEKHKHLSGFIKRLPLGEHTIDEVIRDHRNTVTKVTVEGKQYIVKQYIRPKIYNRIAYTFLRKSKARRSYEYALELIKRGIGTADPVAYIEIRKNGLFHTGFFISEFINEPLLEDIEKFEDKNRILKEFAGFTAELHRQGVVHHDYNPCNILFREENGKYRFSMIDINRMNFRKNISDKVCFNSMKRIGFQLDTLVRYIAFYAETRGWKPEYALGCFFSQRNEFLVKKESKQQKRINKSSKQ